VRTRFPAAAVGLVALATGCAPAAGEPATAASPTAAAIPASAEGGACHLLDYADIEVAIGIRFDVAAATRSRDTYTCVVQPALGGAHLSLSVSTTRADVSVMKDVVAPDGASAVSGLGKWGYRTVLRAARGQGPRVEVGWLSGDGRLLILRLTTAAGTSTAAATAAAPRLVTLAKKIDLSRV
jgi:hypothetical protein